MTVINPAAPVNAATINAAIPGLDRVVQVAAAFALTGGTPTIFTWTAPADGNPHQVSLSASNNCTVAETGGQVTLSYTINGAAKTPTVFAGGAATGVTVFNTIVTVDPGTTVTLAQATAVTVGAASVSAVLLTDHA